MFQTKKELAAIEADNAQIDSMLDELNAGENIYAPADAEPFTPEQYTNLEETIDTHRKVGVAVQTLAAQQFECARIIGQMQAMGMVKKMATTADVVLLRQMKESKAYKGMQLPQIDGSILTINTFDEFCELMGTSKAKVYEDIQNLNTFGEQFMEASAQMGLGYRDLRKLRAVSDDAKALVIEGEKVGNDPEILKDLLVELAGKNAKAKETIAEKEADLDARQKLISTKNSELDKAKMELAKLKNLGPDEQVLLQGEQEQAALKDLHAKGITLMGTFTAFLAQATAIINMPHVTRQTADHVQTIASGMCTQIADSLLDSNIDIDFRILTYPMPTPLRGDGPTEDE